MQQMILGFDVGGTKCAILLAPASDPTNLIDRIQFDTEADKGFAHVKAHLFRHAHKMLQKYGVSYNGAAGANTLRAIGVSCGGPLDCRSGVILSPPHLPGWDKIPFARMLTEEFGAPATLQNDANACALVEWKLGAGRGTRNMVFLTMGTGFGAGIIAENHLVEGANGFAGEVGHIRLEQHGPTMFGKQGTVESFCCGAGIAEIAKLYTTDKIARNEPPAWVREGLPADGLSAKIIAGYADKGDADARAIFEIVGAQLGKALAVIVDLLNPERIVIGSVFVRAEHLLRPAMERTLREEALPVSLENLSIIPAQTGEQLGDYASILVACYMFGIEMREKTAPKPAVLDHYERLFVRHPVLEPLRDTMWRAFTLMRTSFAAGKKLLVCGNGGSAADAEHIVGECMKGFLRKRPHAVDGLDARLQCALPAIALTQHSALSTAFMNDVSPELTFAQQLFGYGQAGDVLLCISTSGNAVNCVRAAQTAQVLGIGAVALTGKTGGALAHNCDVLLNVDAESTPDVQELHLPVYHTLCAMLEAEFFDT